MEQSEYLTGIPHGCTGVIPQEGRDAMYLISDGSRMRRADNRFRYL